MSSVTEARARHAALRRRRPPDDPAVVDAARNLAVANLDAYIRRAVDAAPKLNQAQRDRLAVLLRGSVA